MIIDWEWNLCNVGIDILYKYHDLSKNCQLSTEATTGNMKLLVTNIKEFFIHSQTISWTPKWNSRSLTANPQWKHNCRSFPSLIPLFFTFCNVGTLVEVNQTHNHYSYFLLFQQNGVQSATKYFELASLSWSSSSEIPSRVSPVLTVSAISSKWDLCICK